MTAGNGAPVKVFLPGWGFDAALLDFAGLSGWWSPPGPVRGWPDAIDAQVGSAPGRRLLLAGWSLGAGVALSYALAHPGRIDRLVLLALRRGWPRAELAAIRAGLAADPAGFMTDFYRKCFAGQRGEWQRFKDGCMPTLLAALDPAALSQGLDVLAAAAMPAGVPLPPELRGRVVQLHGRRDLVAPLADIAELPGVSPIILPHAGHGLPFADECRRLFV